MSSNTSYGQNFNGYPVKAVRKALTDEEAARILQAAEDAKNLRSSNMVVIFEYGKMERTNVYKRVA